jgi:hypothetical protein
MKFWSRENPWAMLKHLVQVAVPVAVKPQESRRQPVKLETVQIMDEFNAIWPKLLPELRDDHGSREILSYLIYNFLVKFSSIKFIQPESRICTPYSPLKKLIYPPTIARLSAYQSIFYSNNLQIYLNMR